jgi:hypothetical protein
MKKILVWIAILLSGWFYNSACKAKLNQKERDKIIKLTNNVDMDEY